jgi:hypothetical protein
MKELWSDIVEMLEAEYTVEEVAAKFCVPLDWVESIKTDLEEEISFEEETFLSDAEADANALASMGWGTDEDYGHYGDEF